MKKIAILMATYNGEKYIKQQIESLFKQKNIHIQLFVSDDCSTDNTIAEIEKMQEYCNSIHIISRSMKFGSAAANFFHLVKHVDINSFNYIAFSDQDDIWFDDKLDFAIQELEARGCSGFSSSITAFWPKSGVSKLIFKAGKQTPEDYWFESPGPGCSQVFTKLSFLKFQTFVSENYDSIKSIDYHDWLVYAFYRYNNFNWHISPVSKMLYVQHESNQIGANSGIASLNKRLKMIKIKWFRTQVDLIYKLVTGRVEGRISFKYMVAHALQLRRRKIHSMALFSLYILGIM